MSCNCSKQTQRRALAENSPVPAPTVKIIKKETEQESNESETGATASGDGVLGDNQDSSQS